MIKECKYCGEKFETKYKTQEYCSKSCKGKHQEEIRLKNRIEEYYKFPKICPKCNNPIPFEKRNNKFCSRSCANSYTNSIRKRKPWTEEQRKKMSESNIKNKNRIGYKKYICKYCGCITDNKNLLCEECKPFVGYIRTFNKLGFTQGSLKDRYDSSVKLICEEYFDNKESSVSISDKYNIDFTTIHRFLQTDNRKVRDFNEQCEAFLQRNKSNRCSRSRFITGEHKSWDGKIYTYRSSWEDKYMSMLDKEKVNYIFEPFHIEYYNTNISSYRRAYPDFYLPKTNEIVELKSSYTLKNHVQEMKDKFLAYKKMGYKPKLLLDWEFVDIDKLEENSIKNVGMI